jgi:transcriptional regulator GlxA family with amidase domain
MRIAILAYDGCWGMSLFAARDFFRVVALLESHQGLAPFYEVAVLSPDGGPVALAGGPALQPDGPMAPEERYDLVIVPAMEGPRLVAQSDDDKLLAAWLAAHLQARVPVVAMTTASALLAATGLVDGVLLATHWAFVRLLNKRYPACRFATHDSFRQSEGIYTTGSMNGGFDALLEIVAQQRGDAFSQLCATHLLLAEPGRLRPILPGHRNHTDEAILKAQDWIEAHHGEKLGLAAIAHSCGLGERTLKRRFQEAAGVSPIVYLQKVRIDRAKKLLIATGMTVQEVAFEVGYDNVSFFIRLFRQHVGKTPVQWRSGKA